MMTFSEGLLWYVYENIDKEAIDVTQSFHYGNKDKDKAWSLTWVRADGTKIKDVCYSKEEHQEILQKIIAHTKSCNEPIPSGVKK